MLKKSMPFNSHDNFCLFNSMLMSSLLGQGNFCPSSFLIHIQKPLLSQYNIFSKLLLRLQNKNKWPLSGFCSICSLIIVYSPLICLRMSVIPGRINIRTFFRSMNMIHLFTMVCKSFRRVSNEMIIRPSWVSFIQNKSVTCSDSDETGNSISFSIWGILWSFLRQYWKVARLRLFLSQNIFWPIPHFS